MDFRRERVRYKESEDGERDREKETERQRREKKGTRRDRGEISDRRNTLTSSTFVVFFENQEADGEPRRRGSRVVCHCL